MSQAVVVRRIAATPARPAAEAWGVIVDLLAPAGSIARQELDRAGGIAMSLIASEAMRDSPIVVHGVGPRLRLYCLYDDEAILGEGVSEDPLAWCPTNGNWAMSLPCPSEDLAWAGPALARITSRITVREQTKAASFEQQEQASRAGANLGPIDVEAFLRS